ncbi:MAG TPA: EmrB/QacA family drug resistance transporter, partial [Edaphobacter sp.]|nr:EmrB/QacA family drug resistance transporter [Edaphobacter sp.]
QSENNDVSGLTNLARNVGGSCGTAFMATMLLRRTAAHENSMVRNLTTANPAFNAQVDALKGAFGHGFEAIHAAEAYIYNQLHRQAAMLAYLDIIQYLAVFCACMLPLLFLIPRPPKNARPSAGH